MDRMRLNNQAVLVRSPSLLVPPPIEAAPVTQRLSEDDIQKLNVNNLIEFVFILSK